MKVATLAVSAALLVGAVAQAYPYGHGGYYRGGYGHHRYHDGYAVGVACAPEVLEGNVAATDRTLATIAASKDFAQATAFKAEVKRIAAIQEADARAQAYFKLIGVDAANKDQVAQFIGAREVSGAQLTELQRSTQLSAEQANKVATDLQSALRGNLQ